MAQRIVVKLDVLKHYEKKKLRKYDMIECECLQLNPCQRTPLTFDFKLFYEPATTKSTIPAIPSTQHIIEKEQGSALPPESYDLSSISRPELSTHLPRNNYSGKSAVRPSSASNYLKSNRKTADGSFIILKQKSKQKTAYSTSKVQKTPDTLSDPNCLPARTCSSLDGETSITERKDDITNQSAIYAETRREPTQDLRRESEVKFCRRVHFSSVGLDKRKASLPKDYLINDGQRIQAGFIHDNESVLKKKEVSIPLSFKDELENPKSKIIDAGRVKAERQNLEKMSETFPFFCHHERYKWNLAWNQWLLLYGKKRFDHMNHGNEACMWLNPVLQNNFNDSIAITGNKICPSPNLSAKRKKKPTFSKKPKRIPIEILSFGTELCNVSANSQKGTSLVQKTNGRVTKTITRHAVTEKNILQNMSKRNKDILMANGKNPIGNREHSPSTGVSRIKSSVPDFGKKSLTESKKRLKKGRIIGDCMSFSKPIPVYEALDGFFGHRLPLSVDHSLVMPRSTELSAHRSSSAQGSVLNETETGAADTESRAKDPQSSMRNSGERSSKMTGSSSLLDFEGEEDKSPEPKKSENAAISSEELCIGGPLSPVVSIPTAQPDASESSCLSVPEMNSSCSGKTTQPQPLK